MNKQLRVGLFSLITLTVFLVSAVHPMTARADSGTSTTTDTPAPAATSAPTDAATQAPPPTNTPAPVATDTTTSVTTTTAAPPDSTQAPSSTDTPVPATTVAPTDVTPSATSDVASTSTSVPPTLTTVATILNQAPTGTNVAVLDQNGNTVPLATQQAANIVANGDPIWCPAGKLPGDSSCTPSYSAFNGGSGLLSELQSNPGTYSGNGTIYISYAYTPAGSDVGGVTLDGNTLQGGGANGALGDVTLQGGWDFVSNAMNSSQNYTNFGSNPLTVKNWYGNITVNDIYVSNVSSGNGLTVLVTSGNIRVHHVHSDNNPLAGAQLDNSPGTSSSITVDGNSEFNGNTGNGITAFPGKNGDITLTDVIANGNQFNGASLDNTGSGSTGNINITSSIFSDNGANTTGRGLIAHSNGDITLTDVVASDNGGGGAELDNTTGTGSITLSGNNTFNDNGFKLEPSVGLYAISNRNVTLNGVTATGNGFVFGGGAFLETNGGDLSITNSVFSANCKLCELGVGFAALSAGNVSLNGVTADNNGNDPSNGYTGSALAIGGLIFTDGSTVSVTNSDFSGNCTLGDCAGGGIEVLQLGSAGPVSFDHVTANGNGAVNAGGGAFIASNGNIDINCSTFNNNAGIGLTADVPGGNTITLNGVTLNGNTSGAYDITGGTLINNAGNCASGKKGTVGGFPLNVINVSGGESNALDCTNYSGTELVLPNQDNVLLPCPTTGNASLTGKTNDSLPGKLDSKFTFVSALDAEVTPSFHGTMIVSFKIPAGKDVSNFTILHWDGTKWVEIGGAKTTDGFFQTQTNQTGVFVLVTK